MSYNNTGKSLTLVSIFLLSLFTAMIAVPTVSAVNETTNGTITGTETWTGVMNLDGDIYVAGGAKLIINAGTTINLPADKNIQVAGSICAGDSACGASQASTGSPVRFKWAAAAPAPNNSTGRCYITGILNPDMACGSGLYIEPTIDQSLTRLTHTTFDSAYGIPVEIDDRGTFKYGALVFAGSSVITNSLTFTDINTTNVLIIDGGAPTLDMGTFTVGVDGQGYHGAAIQAYGAGAGLITMKITNSDFTGSEDDCGSTGGGRSAIYLEDSFIDINSVSISQNSYGVFLRSSSGWLTNSIFTTKCNAIDTNSHLDTFGIKHTLILSDNTITTEEGTGITAYDGAIVLAERNTISGASEGSAFGIRSSNVTINNNIIGPIEGWNGLWIYGDSDISAENNTIMNTAKEPVLIGEYHYKDQGWNVPAPTKARIYFANNIVSNNSGTCNSDYMYGGDFNCPAFHIFMSSGTFIGNTVTGNSGDGFLIKGGIVNAQDNNIEVGGFAVNISLFDDNYGNKFGSIGYFSGNTYTNASQIYNITESRVAVQSEYMPDPGAGELYPVSLSWGGAECDPPLNLDECLQTPPTAIWPPAFMPLAMEVNPNATTFTFSDIQNFDRSKIHIQNQNTPWGAQVEQGELVRYQVKADNSHVVDAKVIIKDATGRPLYNMSTDSYGYTQWVTLPSDFHLDRNWNHFAIDAGEDSCGDGIDNDGDTLTDGQDPDCATGRELPLYLVETMRFGKGTANHTFTLTGMVDEVIHLTNFAPSVSVDQSDGTSFPRSVILTGTAHDGANGPYFNDYDSWKSQFGTVQMVEIQPHGSLDWYLATDTSGSNGTVTQHNWPFKTWTYERDMGDHFEEDVTFRVRSNDGLDESVVSTRVFKLNINPPVINLDSPLDGSTHDGQEVLFTGTATDDYTGVQGSDIRDIWFQVDGPNNYSANYPAMSGGGTSWSDTWNFSSLPSGLYTFTVWASDSNYCHEVVDICSSTTITINIDNDNLIPIVQVSEPLPMQAVRADEETVISGVARDNDGQVTRVEISIFDLASGFWLNDGPNPVTTFQSNGAWIAYWDTSKLVHDQQYDISVIAYDGIDYSMSETLRIIIDNPTDANNIAPTFNPDGWASSITIFCDENSKVFDKCNGGASINLLDHFNDSDGAGPASNHFIWDLYDDPTTANDDAYFDFITIDAQGIATYNPIANLQALSADMAEWSLTGVMFEARDAHDSVAFSYTVNFIVKGVKFTAKRVDDGPVVFGDPANYEGTGLPGSQVKARLIDGDIIVNSTLVKADGLWEMDITSAQLGDDGTFVIYFVQDGQTIGKDDDSAAITLQSGDSATDSLSSGVIIALSVVAIIILLGVGAFFFLEFEEFDEDEEGEDQTAEADKDPYAWAKQRAAEQAAAAPAPQPAAQSQNPGWLWDAQSNQWVADPNYQPPPQ
ncbi:MAG TPA: right-handed parallel beta-helix repeat-containing protein [Candidatus Poseidoniales archaeon]|nr:right-handed parallel beta-helix repeat-containing protein [Candidatus Poseidoniales archaeon]